MYCVQILKGFKGLLSINHTKTSNNLGAFFPLLSKVNILMCVVYFSQSDSQQKATNGLCMASFCVTKCVSFQSRRTITFLPILWHFIRLIFLSNLYSYNLTINYFNKSILLMPAPLSNSCSQKETV